MFVLPVVATITVQLPDKFGATKILYPVMAVPPVLVGAVQLRLMAVGPSAVAVSEVGAPGAVARSAVVALAILE